MVVVEVWMLSLAGLCLAFRINVMDPAFILSNKLIKKVLRHVRVCSEEPRDFS